MGEVWSIVRVPARVILHREARRRLEDCAAMTRADDWDAEAATFDQAADHGLIGPARAAWTELLSRLLPPPPAHVADLGCGTGSLAVVLAGLGYQVSGVDFSPAMLQRARVKSAADAATVQFVLGDAGRPPLAPASVDVVLTRHLLWDLPERSAAVSHWARLLRPGGRFVLVEGRWSTGAGLTADETVELLWPRVVEHRVETLDDRLLWGGSITDERYVVVADVGRPRVTGPE